MRLNRSWRLAFPTLVFLLPGMWVNIGCTQTSGAPDASVPSPPTVTLPAESTWATGSMVRLTAVAVDPEGRPLTIAWTQRSGDLVNLTGASSPEVTFLAPAIKTELGFRVTVIDESGLSTTADTRVLIRRNTPATPLPLAMGRTFSYALRETTYAWDGMRGVLTPSMVMGVGTLSLAVTGLTRFNGIEVWSLALTETSTVGGAACTPGGATACASPNLSCGTTSMCASNKPLGHTVDVVQLDGQLFRWLGEGQAPVLIVDPLRPEPPVTTPHVFEGYELMTGQARTAPKNIRHHGQHELSIPGPAVANAAAMSGGMAVMVETLDGVVRTDVLVPYRISRTFYEPGVGVVLFQWEDVPEGYTAQSVQVGYRDAVLTQ